MYYETGSFNPDNLIKVETMEHGALLHTVRSLDTQATRSMEMDTDHPSVRGNLMRNSGDIAMVLKKLIDKGDVSVSDIASEVGISSASLEAALVGETTTFSHGLKLKIIKWLQKSAHIPAVQAISLKGSSEVIQENKLDGSESTNSVNVKSSLVPVDKEAAVEMSDSTVPKTLPPRSNAKILKEEKAICATGATLENGKKNMVKGSADNEHLPTDDFAKESIRILSPIRSKDTSKAVHEKIDTEQIKYLVLPWRYQINSKASALKSQLSEGVQDMDIEPSGIWNKSLSSAKRNFEEIDDECQDTTDDNDETNQQKKVKKMRGQGRAKH